MSHDPRPIPPAPIEINTFGADGARTAQVFTNGDADFRIVGREFTIDVKRAVTPAFVERAERAATAEVAAATVAGLAEAAKARPARKATRRKR